jgi:serine/threonine protein kinase
MKVEAQQAQVIFLTAVESHPPDAWPEYLDEACAGDPALRHRVEVLLHAHQQASSQFDVPAGDSDPTVDQPFSERPGTVIGPYKLLQQIGEGGMGTVYMAEQTHPVQRKVALKIVKAGLDSRRVIARFGAERQALALMDHPNIAKVLDAGTTGPASGYPGRPYFVMELVKGVRITKYCDQEHLSLRERLALFIPVCQAVQHAHSKGIIHRDLKPSNVLVALYDGQPTPKVIDFGLAKATAQPLTEQTLVTELGQIVGTYEYMAPEQAEVNNLDIDTRADIYSLGVILYELLTGSPPFPPKQLRAAGLAEMVRVIRDVEPPRPSARLSSSDELPAIAANRKLEPKKLTKLVHGDLDWIVMKCLEKERGRRYETANGLAMDIQRYLADEPVVAGPPSPAYQLRKFALRHKRLLAGVLAFMLLLVSAVGALSRALLAVSHEKKQTQAALDAEAKRRRQYRVTLDRQTSFVMQDLLGRQAALTDDHKKFLRQALEAYDEFAADTGQDEEARAAAAGAYDRVGMIRQELGDFGEAEAAFRSGLALGKALMGEFPKNAEYRSSSAAILNNLGFLLLEIGRLQPAEEVCREAATIHRSLVADFPESAEHRDDLASSLHNLGNLLEDTGRPDEAEALLLETVALREKVNADSPGSLKFREHLARSQHRLGSLFDRTGRPDDAVEYYRKSLEIYRQLVAEGSDVASHRNLLAVGLTSLASALRRQSPSDESLALHREAVTILQKMVGEYPAVPKYRDNLAHHQFELAQCLIVSGRPEDAEAPLTDAAEVLQQLVTAYPDVISYRQSLVRNRLTLSTVYAQAKRREEAEAVASEALPILEKMAAEHPNVPEHVNTLAGVLGNLAVFRNGADDYAAAGEYLDRALQYNQAALKGNPRHDDYRAFYRNNLYTRTITHLRLGEHAAAVSRAEQMVEAILDPGFDCYKAASLFSRCAETAARDDKLPEAERIELAGKHADRAMDLLRKAVANGFRDGAELTKNTALDPLRPREDFQKLIAELEANER